MTAWTLVPSPVGELRLVTDGDLITAVDFSPHTPRAGATDDSQALLRRARVQVEAYFAGELREFDLPIAASGTPFQQRVWAALRVIPYGATASYGEIASRLGLAPGASRAVGLANGRNPVPVIVPCHRVIGSNGMLTGYGGGLERKRCLLSLEADALF